MEKNNELEQGLAAIKKWLITPHGLESTLITGHLLHYPLLMQWLVLKWYLKVRKRLEIYIIRLLKNGEILV
jgi:hypothetical protein